MSQWLQSLCSVLMYIQSILIGVFSSLSPDEQSLLQLLSIRAE